MNYDPVIPFDKKFNKIEDLLYYGDMENCPYSHPQAISKSYTILNKTRKLLDYIKSWNRLPPIQKMCLECDTKFLDRRETIPGLDVI